MFGYTGNILKLPKEISVRRIIPSSAGIVSVTLRG